MKKQATRTPTWPKNCIWPEPERNSTVYGTLWDIDMIDMLSDPVDEETEELLEVKEYFDELVDEGRLNEDYSLNEDFIDDEIQADDETDETDEEFESEFVPEKGEDYWVDDSRFDLEAWQQDISEHLSLLKLDVQSFPDPVSEIQSVLGYSFINENLLRQAFTRRAFGVEHQVGNSETLEFLGDSVLNTVVTREIARQLTILNTMNPSEPFRAIKSQTSKNAEDVKDAEITEAKKVQEATEALNEGDFTRIRSKFINKEFLANRAVILGLDKFILYGSNEEPSESAREDMIEALIGAVAIDSDWDWPALEKAVDCLVCIQIAKSDLLRNTTYYDLFNSWHQRKFAAFPNYEVYKNGGRYICALRFSIPDNDEGLSIHQRVEAKADTRGEARELAAEFAQRFLVVHNLWVDNLKDSRITPNLEDAINQLQELKQKGYVPSAEYEFNSQNYGETVRWNCDCVCGGVLGFGNGDSKTQAKKQAAFMVLEKLFSMHNSSRKNTLE